jgi:hypothetical protein
VPASARKHAPEASPLSAGPAAASEPVLPKPRHARTEASRPAPTRHGGTSNGATPVEQPAPRQRPPGAKGPRRRKGR